MLKQSADYSQLLRGVCEDSATHSVIFHCKRYKLTMFQRECATLEALWDPNASAREEQSSVSKEGVTHSPFTPALRTTIPIAYNHYFDLDLMVRHYQFRMYRCPARLDLAASQSMPALDMRATSHDSDYTWT